MALCESMSRRLLLLVWACAATAGVLPAAAQAAPPQQLYVSLGDSYATGAQATGLGEGRNTRNGFA